MWWMLLWWGCGSGPAPVVEAPPNAPVAAAPASEPPAVLAAKKLGKSLKERLTGALQAEGPVAAARVCADEAQAITAAANTGGVKVGRTSSKLRNPKNAPPDWVSAWLAAQTPGQPPAPQVTTEAGVSRAVLPIVIEPPCLTCHGPKDALAPEIQALLAERYPDDAATGYAVGDLRGALWAEAPVVTP